MTTRSTCAYGLIAAAGLGACMKNNIDPRNARPRPTDMHACGQQDAWPAAGAAIVYTWLDLEGVRT